MLSRSTLVLACLGLALLGPRVRADLLDAELNKQMPSVMEKLKKDKYASVGVLRVRVHEEGQAQRFDAAFCGSMAERLENLLIMHGGSDEATALRVIHNASTVANRGKVGSWYSQPAERAKLFALRYPLAWGDQTIAADVFLTGKLTISKDLRRSVLVLEMFDKKHPETLTELATIRIATDRSILRDLGYSLVLRQKDRESLVAKRTVSSDEETELFIAGYHDKKASTTKRDTDSLPTPEDIAGVTFQVLVDGKAVAIEEKEGRWQFASPQASAAIAFRLCNRSTKKLAVTLRLNGVNTINEQKEEPELCRKWLTHPGRNYRIKGSHVRVAGAAPAEGDPAPKEEIKVYPFKVLIGEEAKSTREELGDKAGRIDVDVFEEGNAEAATEGMTSSKGLPPSKEKEARASYLALRSALLKSSKLKTQTVVRNDEGLVIKKELIVPDKEAIESTSGIKEEEFSRPRLLKRLTIQIIPAK